jgi:hypothetical protein
MHDPEGDCMQMEYTICDNCCIFNNIHSNNGQTVTLLFVHYSRLIVEKLKGIPQELK